MLKDFDNIVFDLGGVVLDIERDRCVERLLKIGVANADALLDPYRQHGIFLALEEGEITAARFYDELRNMAGNHAITDADLEDSFTAFIVGLPVNRLQALRKLRRMGKRTFVLSNTNPVMYNSVISRLFRQEGLTINDYFDGVIASFAEHACKPDPEIYRILLHRYNLDPSRTLFIDDSKTNVDVGEQCGIKGLYLTKNADFIDVLGLSE